MAEVSMLEKAIGLIPGVGKPKRSKKPATTQVQLVALKRNLAKLVNDVDKLSKLIANGKKKPARRSAATAAPARAGTPSKAARKPASARARSAKARTVKSKDRA